MKKKKTGIFIGLLICTLVSGILGGCSTEAEKPQEKVEQKGELEQWTPEKTETGQENSAQETEASPPQEPVYLTLEKEVYTSEDTELAYRVVNTTGKQVTVVFIPTLEKQVGDTYEKQTLVMGFCGVGDPVDAEREGTVPLDWFDGLTEGNYRLSFQLETVTEDGTEDTPLYAFFLIR